MPFMEKVRLFWIIFATVTVNDLEQTLITKLSIAPSKLAPSEDCIEVTFEQGAGVLQVLFAVGFGGGNALKRFVEDAYNPLLLCSGIWNLNQLIMNKVSIQSWHTSPCCKSLQIKISKQVKNKTRIVSVKILHIENCVQRPEIFFHKEDIPDASASPCNNARPTNGTLVMRIADAA